MRNIGALLLACLLPCCASFDVSHWNNDPSEAGTAFVGGRGNVSSEGPAGLFVNPASGTPPKGQVTAQICASTFDNGAGGSFTGTKWLMSYGVRDWLEVGATALDVQNDNTDPAFGPMISARVMRDIEKRPEVTVGYYSNEGRTPFQKRVVFLASSKKWDVGERQGFLKHVRVHAGARHAWRDINPNSDVVGWGGIEFAFPYNLYLIGEVATEDANLPHTPFGFGLQVRHPSGIGMTLAGMQPGFSSDIGLLVGIGINFGFSDFFDG